MELDTGLWIVSLVVEAALVGLLLYRRVWQTIPILTVFCATEVLSSGLAYLVMHYSSNSYPLYYLVESVLSAVLEFGVLVELAWSVLRPMRASLSPRTPFVIAIVILAIGAAIWPFSALPSLAGLPRALQAIAHLQQTTAVLRVLLFLTLAGCSQLLSIGWRDRELQVATGLGFYSLVSLGTAMVHTHQASWAQYRHLNQLLLGSYICSLVYWIFSFAQKEAERREFTPQMQNLLLAVAGVARAERTALTATSPPGNQLRKDR
jgi:hypothetical protein